MTVALAVAAALALVAYRLHLLTLSGAAAATFIGAATVIAGVEWVILLLFFFATSSALSRWRHHERDRLVASIIEKGGRRDAMQVLCNGAVFAVAAVASTVGDVATFQAIGVGAIASATADTWSTEVGTVLGGPPRFILNGRKVASGTSGGITIGGTLSGLLGAVLTGFITTRMHWVTPVYAVVAGGVTGMLMDSLLGAVLQERRWCTTCAVMTERRRHSCGAFTVHREGIRGFDNDVVNLVSIIAGAVVTWTLS